MSTKRLKDALSGITAPVYVAPQNGSATVAQQEATVTEMHEAYKTELTKLKKQNSKAFPIDAFPPKTRAILREFHDCEAYPIDYYGTNALVAVAALLGVAYKARYRRGHEHYPIIYAALVGNSSAGKGRSMRPVFSALYRIEEEYHNEYIAKKTTWIQECDETRMADGLKAKMPPEPVQKEVVMDNATLEALLKTMYRNPRGLLSMQEELLGWILSMNAYRSGSDEQFWLKNWDAAYVKITRTSAETMTIKNPNCSVIGGIQPELVHKILTDGKGDSGFSARILMAYPDETPAPYDSERFPTQQTTQEWFDILNYINKLPNRIALPEAVGDNPIVEEAVAIDCTEEAKRVYKDYFNKLADEINRADNDRVKSLIGKLQAYCMRFALIIEMLTRAENRTAAPQHADVNDPNNIFEEAAWEKTTYQTWEEVEQNIQITHESMNAAKKLTEYYKSTGIKVLNKLETPADSLRSEQQAWYRSLPMDAVMTYAKMREVATKCGISESTMKRLIKPESRLFKRDNLGYKRIYA
jgi:hypothetical protein